MAPKSKKSSPSIPTILLCGGRGTRIQSPGQDMPKAMMPIGNRPVLWHIMKIYAACGYTDFIVALGYLGYQIKDFFLHFDAFTNDFSLEIGKADSVRYLSDNDDLGWNVTCVDTGLDSLTGTRVRRAADRVPADTYFVTYGDGVADLDITAILEFHRSHGRLATITAVHPPGRFGELNIASDGKVNSFEEKPQISAGLISGGFMVFEREAIDRYISDTEDVMLERKPLSRLASDGQLMAYEHNGFWQPMDTPRERDLLEKLWSDDAAPWKVW